MKMMTLCMRRLLSRFARDKRGVSAVEFAFLAPLMIAMYLGVVEISDGVAADRKVTLTAGALANLTAQSQTLLTADMTNIFTASTAILKPYSVGNLKATVSCLKIDSLGPSPPLPGVPRAAARPARPVRAQQFRPHWQFPVLHWSGAK